MKISRWLKHSTTWVPKKNNPSTQYNKRMAYRICQGACALHKVTAHSWVMLQQNIHQTDLLPWRGAKLINKLRMNAQMRTHSRTPKLMTPLMIYNPWWRQKKNWQVFSNPRSRNWMLKQWNLIRNWKSGIVGWVLKTIFLNPQDLKLYKTIFNVPALLPMISLLDHQTHTHQLLRKEKIKIT